MWENPHPYKISRIMDKWHGNRRKAIAVPQFFATEGILQALFE